MLLVVCDSTVITCYFVCVGFSLIACLDVSWVVWPTIGFFVFVWWVCCVDLL